MKKLIKFILIIAILLVIRAFIVNIELDQSCAKPEDYYRQYATDNQLTFYNSSSIQSVVEKVISQFEDEQLQADEISTFSMLSDGFSPQVIILQLKTSEQADNWQKVINVSNVGGFIAEIGQTENQLIIATSEQVLNDFQEQVENKVCAQ